MSMESIYVEVSKSGSEWIESFRDEIDYLRNKSDITDIISQLILDYLNGMLNEKDCLEMLNTMQSYISLIDSLRKPTEK